MAGAFARGQHTLNSVFLKPMVLKSYHNKISPANTLLDAIKIEAEELKNKNKSGDGEASCWVPDERTGIYYPKGQEKVLEGIPQGAGKDIEVNWLSSVEDA